MKYSSCAVRMLREVPVYPNTVSIKKLTRIIGKNASEIIKIFDSSILLAEDGKGNLCYPTIQNKEDSIRRFNICIGE